MPEKSSCYQTIAKKFADNKIKEGFVLIEKRLEVIGYPTDLTPLFATVSAKDKRTQKAYTLGTISWEQYNTSSSQIIQHAPELAELLCEQVITEEEMIITHFGEGDKINDKGQTRLILGKKKEDEEWGLDVDKIEEKPTKKSVVYDKKAKKFRALEILNLRNPITKQLGIIIEDIIDT